MRRFACALLRERGLALRRIAVVSDDVAEIAQVVAAFAARYSAVVTTGGVGPTHDDVTLQAPLPSLGARPAPRPAAARPPARAAPRAHHASRARAGRRARSRAPHRALGGACDGARRAVGRA